MIDAIMNIITIKTMTALICFSNGWENLLISFRGTKALLWVGSLSAILNRINVVFFLSPFPILLGESETMYINNTITPLTYTIRIKTPAHVSILCLKVRYETKKLFAKIVIRRAIGLFLLVAVAAITEVVITQNLVYFE